MTISAHQLSQAFIITPDKLVGDKALARAARKINKRFLYMSMEDVEFIARTMAHALKIELEKEAK